MRSRSTDTCSATRRGLLALMGSTCAGASFAQGAAPGNFPVKPIRLVVTFPPGGSSDAVVRLLVPIRPTGTSWSSRAATSTWHGAATGSTMSRH